MGTRLLSYRNITCIGMLLVGVISNIPILCNEFYQFFGTSLVRCFALALTGGGLVNYLLKKIPGGERPTYLVAWYSTIMNAGILASSLLSPIISSGVGITLGLLVFGFCRIAAGILILKWG